MQIYIESFHDYTCKSLSFNEWKGYSDLCTSWLGKIISKDMFSHKSIHPGNPTATETKVRKKWHKEKVI